MPIYSFPGVRVVSRYQWSLSSLIIAIVVVIGLFLIARWVASEARQGYYLRRPWGSKPTPDYYRPLPMRVLLASPTRGDAPANDFEAFEIESEQPRQQPRVIGERLYPRQKRRRLTRAQRRSLVEAQRGRCAICGRAFQGSWEIQIDHKVPIAACKFGFDESRVNLDDNLWALCLRCHAIKTADERSRGLYSRRT